MVAPVKPISALPILTGTDRVACNSVSSNFAHSFGLGKFFLACQTPMAISPRKVTVTNSGAIHRAIFNHLCGKLGKPKENVAPALKSGSLGANGCAFKSDIGKVGTSDERSSENIFEAKFVANSLQLSKFFGRDISCDGQVPCCRADVLTDGHNVATDGPKVSQNLHNFFHRFAQPDHQSRLGQHLRG